MLTFQGVPKSHDQKGRGRVLSLQTMQVKVA